jgi:hypothetical protein
MYGEGLEAGSPVLVDRSIYHGNGPPPFISCPPHQASRLLRAPSGVKTLKEPGENRFLDMTDGILITPKSPILQVTGIRPQFSSVLINAEVSCISLESYFALTVAHYSLRGNFFRMGSVRKKRARKTFDNLRQHTLALQILHRERVWVN